jgi:hypothetical protein
MPATQIVVTVSDLEPLDSDIISLQDISFRVCLGLDVVSYSSYQDIKSVPVDMKALASTCIRVMVFNKNTLYGCISFDNQTEFGEQGQTHKQWVTIFDDTDDDTYDGILGQDDEEGPRVLISFHYASLDSQPAFDQKSKIRQFTKDDDEVEMQSVAPLPTQQNNKPAALLTSKTKVLRAFDVKANKKEEMHGEVSTLFGGTQEPKLRTTDRPDVRADKQEALAAIN